MEAVRYHSCRSYWTETSASKNLMDYISMDFDGLSKTIAELLGGIEAAQGLFIIVIQNRSLFRMNLLNPGRHGIRLHLDRIHDQLVTLTNTPADGLYQYGF